MSYIDRVYEDLKSMTHKCKNCGIDEWKDKIVNGLCRDCINK